MDTRWIELNLKTKRENEEYLTDFLMGLGIEALSIEDDKAIFDLAKNPDRAELIDLPESYSDFITAKVFFEEDDYPNFKDRIHAFISSSQDAGIKIDLVKEDKLEDTNWATEWMKYYEIIHIGNIVIVPQWKDYTPLKGEYVVKINPGLAFGTGDHPTTSMCLSYMEGIDLDGKRVLDMGCGSGILSIAADKLGAAYVLAADYDKDAIEKTRENIALNFSKNIETCISDLTQNINGKFDFALVNIIAEIIVRLLQDLHTYLKPGARLIFSGILEEKEAMMKEALKDRYEILSMAREDGWLAIEAKCTDVS